MKVYTSKWIKITVKLCNFEIFLFILLVIYIFFILCYSNTTYKSSQQWWIYTTAKMSIVSRSSSSGCSSGSSSRSKVFYVTIVKPLNVSWMKKVPLFIHMQDVDHKERFLPLFSFCFEKYFSKRSSHSESNRDLGRVLLCPRSHSEVQYELQIEWNVLGRGRVFGFSLLSLLFIMWKISAKKYWCCSWPRDPQPFNHFMPMVFIQRYLNPRGLGNFAPRPKSEVSNVVFPLQQLNYSAFLCFNKTSPVS